MNLPRRVPWLALLGIAVVTWPAASPLAAQDSDAVILRWYGEPWVRTETILDPADVSGRMRRTYDRSRQLWVVRFEGFGEGSSMCVGRFGWNSDLRDDAVEKQLFDCTSPEPGQVMGSQFVITEVERTSSGGSIRSLRFEPPIQGQSNCRGRLELDSGKPSFEGNYTCRRTGTGRVLEVITRVDLELRPLPGGGR